MLEDIDVLDLKIARHDKHRFETKLDIITEVDRKTAYKVETYFFIPKGLNINFQTYKKDDFYNNIQNNIRFKTPVMSVKNLIDPDYELSPFNEIDKLLLGGQSASNDANLIYEIKMLGCILRGFLRDNTYIFLKKITAAKKGEIGELEKKCLRFVEDLEIVINKTRKLSEKILTLKLSDELKQAFSFFDEFFNLNLAEYLSLSLKKMREENIFPTAEKEISKIIRAQNIYRRQRGYKTLANPTNTNEGLIYRRSILKKFISSALFLNIKTIEFEPVAQVFLGFAAAIAMLFTVLVLLAAQTKYAVNSVPFVAVLVVSYIFKDRIKDWLKLWLTKSWTKWIYDRKTKIYHSDPKNYIGIIKEAFSFVIKKKISKEVLGYRNIENLSSVYEHGKPESVVKYEKEVILNPKRFKIKDVRKKNITDIMRFNILAFLTHADDAKTSYLYYDDEIGKLNSADCLRTYHINAITGYTSYNKKRKQVSYERIRLVLTREGILRLEEVSLKK